ncbi:MAG TPA: NUDIX hydrolase [Pseudomonadales bacterium]|nr:NUDIX hydrolase [Pseudomonadales bacterium]
MTEYDETQVSIRQAATVMLVDDRPDLQVFVMERNANIVFGGGMWVFPGGAVDVADHPDSYQHISGRRSDVEASTLMDIASGGLAYYIAAIREAFEEAGVLLALRRDNKRPLNLRDRETAARFQDHRDKVNSGERDFIDVVNAERLILDAGAMHYVARWITPVGPPRRFDARFFVARMPEEQVPGHDDGELVHSRWLPPKEILRRFDAGDMDLMSPTLRMVRCLAKFSSADEVIASAASNLPDERARVNKEREIILPGDPGYEDADESIENGWVRLRPLN